MPEVERPAASRQPCWWRIKTLIAVYRQGQLHLWQPAFIGTGCFAPLVQGAFYSEAIMDNWQQIAFREDPFHFIPFAAETGLSIDAKVGLVCIAAALIVWLCGG